MLLKYFRNTDFNRLTTNIGGESPLSKANLKMLTIFIAVIPNILLKVVSLVPI